MKSLIRFEDTYGMADIFCSANGIVHNFEQNKFYKVNDNLFIEVGKGITNCIGVTDAYLQDLICEGVDRILFIFDVDNEEGDKNKLLSLNYIRIKTQKVKQKFIREGYNIKLEFLPVVYSAETIMLYQFIQDSNPETDVEGIVHKTNTNDFQLLLLAKILGLENTDKAKHFSNYLDFNKLKSKITKNMEVRESINKKLFEWILNDCNPETEHYTMHEVIKFVEQVHKLFEYHMKNPITFKIGNREYTNQMSISKFENID